MSDKFRVTALVPNYNQGRFFKDALNGLLVQTRKPDTIVVVDDASTDGSLNVIIKECEITLNCRFSKQANKIYGVGKGINIIIIGKEKNSGPSATRNIGIQATIDKTDLYALNDCDDIYHPDKIAKSLEVFTQYPETSLVYTDMIRWDTGADIKQRFFYGSFNYDALCASNTCNNNPVVAANAYKIAGLYDESLRVAEDYDMWLRIAEFSVFCHIPEALYTYRVTGQNADTVVQQNIWSECLRKVHQKRLERRKRHANING